jgi:hypothetical protein
MRPRRKTRKPSQKLDRSIEPIVHSAPSGPWKAMRSIGRPPWPAIRLGIAAREIAALGTIWRTLRKLQRLKGG